MKTLKKIFFTLLVFFLFYTLTKNITNYQKKIQFYQGFKNNYEKEKKEYVSLKTEILKNKDLNQTEKTIRNKLSLLKPDEVAIILEAPTPAPSIITPTPMPNWRQWWEVFTKN